MTPQEAPVSMATIFLTPLPPGNSKIKLPAPAMVRMGEFTQPLAASGTLVRNRISWETQSSEKILLLIAGHPLAAADTLVFEPLRIPFQNW